MNRRLAALLTASAIVLGAGASQAQAAPFTPGNIVVERLSGLTPSGAGAAISLDEFTSAGVFVQSVALPTTVSESNSATSNGALSLSVNRRYLMVPAYGAPPGTTGVVASGASRVPVRVDNNGVADTSTQLTNASTYTGNNFRSVASPDGVRLFLAGTSSGTSNGIRTAVLGDTSSTQVSSTTTNTRIVQIFGDQLFYSTGSAPTGVFSVGSGLPTAASTTSSLVQAGGTSPFGFYFADLSPTIGFTTASGKATRLDTLYIADDGAGSVSKFSYDGTAWVQSGSVTGVLGAFSVAARESGGTVTLYVGSNSPTMANSVRTLTDATGYNGAISNAVSPATVFATAAAGNFFRGVALAPVAATAVRWQSGKAVAGKKGVLVSWKSGRDAELVGFDVLRVRKRSTKRVRISKKMIPGSAVSGPGGNTGAYKLRDVNGKRGDRYYVVARSTSGTKKVHGPLVARASTRKVSR